MRSFSAYSCLNWLIKRSVAFVARDKNIRSLPMDILMDFMRRNLNLHVC